MSAPAAVMDAIEGLLPPILKTFERVMCPRILDWMMAEPAM
jgi:hypothetical protein